MVLPASAPISDSGLPMVTLSAYVPGETRTVSFAAAAVIAAPMVALQPDEAAALTHHVAPVAGRMDTPVKISSQPPWVLDPGNGRFTRFSHPEGRLITLLARRPGGGVWVGSEIRGTPGLRLDVYDGVTDR